MLEQLVMPAILLRQLYVFYDAGQPVGIATWAFCSKASAAKLQKGLLAKGVDFTAEDWKSG